MDYEKEKLDMLATIIRATAHPVRLFLLQTLMDNRYCVKELADMLPYDFSTISRHLQQMKSNGLLRDEREGNCVYYRLECDCVRRYFDAAMSILRSNIERNNRLLQKEL